MAYKQIFLINSELGMDKGKIAVQTAHAEIYYMETILEASDEKIDKYIEWRDELMRKIILKATEQQMNELSTILHNRGIFYAPVYDKGLTQVPENSFTCLIVEPLPEEECTALFGHLKLL